MYTTTLNNLKQNIVQEKQKKNKFFRLKMYDLDLIEKAQRG